MRKAKELHTCRGKQDKGVTNCSRHCLLSNRAPRREADRPSGLLLFVPALLLSILTPLFLPSSSVFLSYFVLAVPILECLGKHSCMSSPCPIAILNGTFLFSVGEIVCNLGRSFVYQNQIKLN